MMPNIPTTVNYSRVALETLTFIGVMAVMFWFGRMSTMLDSDAPYECTFRNVLGEFNVTEKSLHDDGSMMIVTRDERIIMLDRSLLVTCILLEE